MKLLRKKNIGSNRDVERILDDTTPFAVTEAYRAVRTNLSFMSFDGNCRVFAFTSGDSSEGKTTSCMNTALSMSQTGKRVLLIDSDMRKAKAHRFFNIKLSPGLSEYLAGMSEKACIVETDYENLYVLPAGKAPPNPAELLTSKMMSGLIKGAQGQFDYIFIDTPPVNVVTDAAVLSGNVSGYVIVVRANQTRIEDTTKAVSALKQIGANIVGFLLNDISYKNKVYKYKKGYKYTNYSDTEN